MPTRPIVAELRKGAPRSVTIVERDRDINDPAFATEAATTLIGLMHEAAAA
jgi:hypothetical protein